MTMAVTIIAIALAAGLAAAADDGTAAITRKRIIFSSTPQPVGGNVVINGVAVAELVSAGFCLVVGISHTGVTGLDRRVCNLNS